MNIYPAVALSSTTFLFFQNLTPCPEQVSPHGFSLNLNNSGSRLNWDLLQQSYLFSSRQGHMTSLASQMLCELHNLIF